MSKIDIDQIDVKYIDTSKVRRTISNMNFSTDLVYQAHSQSNPGYIPYVPKRVLEEAIKECEELEKKLQAWADDMESNR